jgi:MFS family permease
MCYGAITIVTILLYRNHFHTHGLLHAGLAGLGQLVSAGALGLLAGALLTPLAARRLRLRTWAALALGAIGLAILAFVLPLSLAPMLAGGFVIGFGGQATKITVDTIVQEAIVDAFRARVFALYDALYNASYVAAAALAAVVLPKSGVAPGLVAGLGAGYLAVALLYGLSGRRGSTPGPAGTPADSVLPARLGGAAPPG